MDNDNHDRVTYGSYDAEKKILHIQRNDICFARFPNLQHNRAEWVRYKTKNHVVNDYEKDYFEFIKTLWHFKETIPVSAGVFNREGIWIPVKQFNTFEVYTTLVALRYLDEFNSFIREWHKKYYLPLKHLLTPLQAFILCHHFEMGMHNSNHTFWTPIPISDKIEDDNLEKKIASCFPSFPRDIKCYHYWEYRKKYGSERDFNYSETFNKVFEESVKDLPGHCHRYNSPKVSEEEILELFPTGKKGKEICKILLAA